MSALFNLEAKQSWISEMTTGFQTLVLHELTIDLRGQTGGDVEEEEME